METGQGSGGLTTVSHRLAGLLRHRSFSTRASCPSGLPGQGMATLLRLGSRLGGWSSDQNDFSLEQASLH